MGEGKFQGEEPLLPCWLPRARGPLVPLAPLPPRCGVWAGGTRLAMPPDPGLFPQLTAGCPWLLVACAIGACALEVTEPCGDEAGVTVLPESWTPLSPERRGSP